MSDKGTTTGDTNISSILEGYIDEREYCTQRGVSLRTAQRERRMRRCPPHVIFGNRVLYRIEAVRSWLLERERRFGDKTRAASVRGRK